MKSIIRKLSIMSLLVFFAGGLLKAQVADFVYFNPCKGAITQFVNTSTYPSGITLYEWDFGDGSTLQTGLEVTHTFNQAKVYYVTLTLYNGASVVDQISKNVSIHSVPDAGFTATVACFGDAVEFTNTTVSNDGSIVDWVWNFGDGEGDVLEDVNHFYAEPGTYSVNLVATTNYGCSDEFTADVAVFELPDATITVEDMYVCEGNPVKLSVNNIYDNVLWSTDPDITSPSVESFNIEVDYGVGSHTVVAKVYEIHAQYPFFQVCEDVDTTEVFVTPTPELDITASEVDVLPGAHVQLGVSSTNTQLSEYVWTPLNLMPNPYISNPLATLFETTTFTVDVTDASGCTSSASILVEVDLRPNTVVTPNADGKNDTWIVTASGLSTDFDLAIYNRWGEVVLSQKGYENDWDGTSNGYELPEGAYYYIIKIEEMVYTGSINLLR